MGLQLPPKQGTAPVFGSCICGQTAGWMKTTPSPLGTEVDLGPCHIVLDGFPASGERGTAALPPHFGPCLLWSRSPISATAELLLRYVSGQTDGRTDMPIAIFCTVPGGDVITNVQ